MPGKVRRVTPERLHERRKQVRAWKEGVFKVTPISYTRDGHPWRFHDHRTRCVFCRTEGKEAVLLMRWDAGYILCETCYFNLNDVTKHIGGSNGRGKRKAARNC